MLGGSLDAGPSLNIGAGETLAVGSNGSVLKSALVLEKNASLSVDYSGTGSATSLNDSVLVLQGGSMLQLSGCGNGDGKTYTLFTGISEVKDTQGNALDLGEGSNAISSYFDITQPGTGFWAGATLQLTDDGILQFMRHNETVKEAVTITSRLSGGADYRYYAGVTFSKIEYKPAGHGFGGAIGTSYYSSIELKDNGGVEFSKNTVSSSYHAGGGAIYGERYSSLMMSGNGGILFCDNAVSSREGVALGGAIGGYVDGSITLKENGEVTFKGNNASSVYDAGGGAIRGSSIIIENNGSIEFYCNTATSSDSSISHWARGGAIYGNMVKLNGNGEVLFKGNVATSASWFFGYGSGGAIYSSSITVDNNGSIEFCENSAISGGSLYGSDISLKENRNVEFNKNSSDNGGAILGSWSIELNDNGRLIFSENNATYSGGAIYGYHANTFAISGNDSVKFSGNTAGDANSYSDAAGGAIDGYSIELIQNASVEFNENRAFGVNATGGAIFAGVNLSLNDNAFVSFCGNATSAYSGGEGGAIYTRGDLSIRNNGSVLFEKNAEISNGSYRLRSVYANGYMGEIALSAAAGKSIEFRDSVYINSTSSVELNRDYTYLDEDGASVTAKQQGDIIFTGKYTEQHLNNMLDAAGAKRTATSEEILTSRTTEVNTMTNLYGGRLRVEDGAIYQGYGITAHAGSDSTVLVKDAVLNHTGYELHFYEGTKLEALGESEIFGDVIVESTATAAFSALTRLEGSLTLALGSTLLLEGALTLDGALALGTSLTLGGNMLEMVNLLQAGQSLTLMSGLDSLAVQTGESEYTTIASGQELLAADYFSNLDSGKELVFVYNGEAGSLSMMRVIPEPATATLSLLALTALMSRRRRK